MKTLSRKKTGDCLIADCIPTSFTHVAFAALALGFNVTAQAATPPLPHHIDLWVSPPPDDGNLETCADRQLSEWEKIQSHVPVVGGGQENPSIKLSRLARISANPEVTQRCFQLRQNSEVIAQGAILPEESARRLGIPMLVLVLHYRSAAEPEFRLGCGFPPVETSMIFQCPIGWINTNTPLPGSIPWTK